MCILFLSSSDLANPGEYSGATDGRGLDPDHCLEEHPPRYWENVHPALSKGNT